MHGIAEVGAGDARQCVEFGMAGCLDGRRPCVRHSLRVIDREVGITFHGGHFLRRHFILRRTVLQPKVMPAAATERGETVPHRQRAGRCGGQWTGAAGVGHGLAALPDQTMMGVPAVDDVDAGHLVGREHGQLQVVQRHVLCARAANGIGHHVAPRQHEHVAGVDGAGQRHVQDAMALLEFLLLDDVLGRPFDEVFRRPVIGAEQSRTLVDRPVLPHQRQEHHAELQPLAGVQGHQLDACGIRFQPQRTRIGGVAAFGTIGHLVGEPRQQLLAAATLVPGLLQQLAEVAQVGEDAFAFRRVQQARGVLFQQCRHQRQRATLLQGGTQGMEAAGVAVPSRRVVAQRLQGAEAGTAQARGQRGTQRARILGMQRRMQDQPQLAGDGGLEHALLRTGHAGHAARLEHHRQFGDLCVAG